VLLTTRLYQAAETGLADLNGACKTRLMLTLNALCTDMEVSGRYLSQRTAREWWTKGLLPRPRRRGLGRGRGTETFWTDPRVSAQAQAAYDLLALSPRADIALVSLWLLGFPMSLRSIRANYWKLIKRDRRSVHERAGKRPDDIIGKFAEEFARQQARESSAPVGVRQAPADLAVEFLGIFYGTDSEFACEGLAELWEKAAPYIGGGASRSGGLAELYPRDELLATWARYFKEMASLTAQKDAVESASDYELIRARRVLLLVFGFLRGIARATERQSDSEEFGRRLLIVLGRPAVPILVSILRKDALRRKIMSLLLYLVQMNPDPAEWPAHLRVASTR
jgi:hypothetical protein